MRVLLGPTPRSKQRKLARAVEERDERDAPPGDLSETRHVPEERDEREAPRSHSSETRGEQPPDSKMVRQ